MKKILIFHPYLAPYRIDLYNKLSEKYNLFVLLIGSQKEKQSLGFNLEYVNNLAKFSFKYIDKGIYLGRHLLSLVYFKNIISLKPDVVFGHELGINTIASIILKPFFKYKIIVTFDDSPSMIKNYTFARKIIQKFIVKNVETILTVHPEVTEYLQDIYNKEKNKFIYFPIIQDDNILKDKIIRSKSIASNFKTKYNIDHKKVILYVGRLETVKSPELLLQSFYKLNDSSLFLVFVGDGSLKKYLIKKSIELKLDSNILFTGRLSGNELYAWYYLADIFVLPSQFEPFGAVVNEALVAGCKVIVSDQVGANSLIAQSNGIIFDSKTTESLKIALKKTINNSNLKLNSDKIENQMIISFEELIKNLIQRL